MLILLATLGIYITIDLFYRFLFTFPEFPLTVRIHPAENDAEAQVAPMEIDVATPSILQLKFQSLQSHSGTIAEIVSCQDLIENHFVLIAAYGDFLDDSSLTSGSYRAVCPQIGAMNVDVSDALKLQIATGVGGESFVKGAAPLLVAEDFVHILGVPGVVIGTDPGVIQLAGQIISGQELEFQVRKPRGYSEIVLPGVISGRKSVGVFGADKRGSQLFLDLRGEIRPVIVPPCYGNDPVGGAVVIGVGDFLAEEDIQLVIHVFFNQKPAVGDADVVDIEDAVFGEQESLGQLELEVAVAYTVSGFVFGVDVDFLHG
jgi:hypothetical protein